MSVTKGWGVDCADWTNKRETTIDQGERIIMFFLILLTFGRNKNELIMFVGLTSEVAVIDRVLNY